MTIVTAEVSDITGRPDNTRWEFLTPVRVREGSVEGSIITNRTRLVQPLDGSIRVELDPGPATIKYDGNEWEVTIPEEDSSLWDIISAAVAVPPDTALAMIGSAVSAWLQENPPSGDIEVDNISDAGTVGAEVVKATTQAAARTAIGAGTSNLTIGTTGSTAKAGNWVPAADDISDASDSGKTVVTGTPAEARDAISVVSRGDRPRNILDYGVSIGTGASQTVAIKAAMNAYPGAAFGFPPGDYRLDTGLVVDSNNSILLDAGARIYAGASMSTLISYDNGEASGSLWAQDKHIIGEGTLDGALLAGKVLSVARVIRMTVEGFTIADGINRGLYTDPLGAEVGFRNVRIHNTGTTNVADNIAVEANMGDCLFQDFIIRDCTVGVRDNGGNVWSNVHPWLGALSQLTARYADSICFDLNGNSVLINPYADTYRTSYKVRADKRARIISARAYCNQGNLSDALAAANPGTILDLDTTARVQFTGAELEGHPTTSHTFITGSPTFLTAHTNRVVRGVTGLADYRSGVKQRVPEQHLPAAYDDFTAADGTALDAGRWTVSTGGAAAAGITTNGNRARLTSGATGSYAAADRAFMKSNLAAVADVELLLKHTYGVVANESYTRYAVRSSNTDPQTGNSYFVTFQNNGIVMSKAVAGSVSNIAGGSLAFLGLSAATDGSSKWLRFRAKGTFLAFKVWDDGTDEPIAWTSAITDSSVTAAGNVVAAISGGSAAVSVVTYLDRFSIIPLDDVGLPEAVASALNGKQPSDSDLTAIGGLTPSDDDILQRKSGVWTNRTVAQLKTDLGVATDLATRQPKVMTGTVSTIATTAAKTVTLDAPWASVTPAPRDELSLTWTNGNNTSLPTLAVNGGSAFPITTGSGGTSGPDHLIATGYTTRLQFDGTRWVSLTPTLITLTEISNTDILNGSTNYRLMSGLRAAYLKRKAINTTVASSATPAISLDLGDWSTIAVGHNITAITTTGTGHDLQTVNLKLVGTGAYTLAFGSTWNFGFGVSAPASIANAKAIYIFGRWNSTTSKIDVLDVKQEA